MAVGAIDRPAPPVAYMHWTFGTTGNGRDRCQAGYGNNDNNIVGGHM